MISLPPDYHYHCYLLSPAYKFVFLILIFLSLLNLNSLDTPGKTLFVIYQFLYFFEVHNSLTIRNNTESANDVSRQILNTKNVIQLLTS